MNLKSLVEKELFKTRTKKSLITDAMDSCKAIVEDVFLGQDVNNLRADFPEEISFSDIKIVFQALRLNLEHNNVKTPSVEVAVSMLDAEKDEIGYYLIIYDDELSRIDEYFVIE